VSKSTELAPVQKRFRYLPTWMAPTGSGEKHPGPGTKIVHLATPETKKEMPNILGVAMSNWISLVTGIASSAATIFHLWLHIVAQDPAQKKFCDPSLLWSACKGPQTVPSGTGLGLGVAEIEGELSGRTWMGIASAAGGFGVDVRPKP